MKKWMVHPAGALVWMILTAYQAQATDVLVEAEGFSDKGGWVVDQQFMDQMGSPFLMAHGAGVAVDTAVTTVSFPDTGTYHVYVRTRDWVYPYGPGTFKLAVNGTSLDTVFGTGGAGMWYWQYGGTVHITATDVPLALQDVTGFEGRCDALLFTDDADFTPPNTEPELTEFRKTVSGFPGTPPDADSFDLVIVGGGMAGACAAVSAARCSLKVALIQDRPVLGGNNSSEVRVHLQGGVNLEPFPDLGSIVNEFDSGRSGNAGPASNYDDGKKLGVVQGESNISLYLNMHAFKVEMDSNRITAVWAKHIETGEELRFPAGLFADCTGDGNLGYMAGADFRTGRESQSQTSEGLAPATADSMHMGASNLWYATQGDSASSFPVCPWALQFSADYNLAVTRCDWQWESGFYKNMITQAEDIRDHNFRAIYGNWAYLKNGSVDTAAYADWALDWVAYISGRRESRRLLGDVILKQEDITGAVSFPDACVTCTWSIDLHYPDTQNTVYFPGEEFISRAEHASGTSNVQYPIPYRCLYSRNIDNLFMAGRCISVTHIALGKVRVMRTTGMMGEVLGRAAYVCKRYGTTPRGVYDDHLDTFLVNLNGGQPLSEYIFVDDADAEVIGDWTSSTYNLGFYGTGYLHDGDEGKGDKEVRFTADLPDSGTYTVNLRWTASNNRATNVPIIIRHAAGRDTLTVNMQSQGSMWNPLGAYRFEAGTSDTVIVQNRGTDGYVIVDAVGFEREAPDTVVAISDETGNAPASGLQLYQLHPVNNGGEDIVRFRLPVAASIRLDVFDGRGNTCGTLARGYREAGSHSVCWDASRYGSGVYYLKLSTSYGTIIRKSMLVK